MTATDPDHGAVPSEIWDELLTSFASKASPRPVPAADKPQAPPVIQWLPPVARALNRLPYLETNLPDQRMPPTPEAAAALLWLLLNILDGSTRAPTSINTTSKGGVAAEWHVGGIDLEIECGPDGTAEYNFAGGDVEEYEGPVDPDLSQLKWHVNMLPKRNE